MNIIFIDGNNNFIRSYAVVPTQTANGEPNGGVIGFLRSLSNFCYLMNPDKIVIAWDGQGGSKKRRSMLEGYKEGRKPIRLNRNYDHEMQNPEQNKVYQRIRLGEYLNDLPVHQLSIPDIEADDTIAYLTKMFPCDKKTIISNDRDFIQLMSDEVQIYSPTKKEFLEPSKIVAEYGVHPVNFALARAIVGDDSDCIKGIGGVGFVKLAKLFPEFAQPQKFTLDLLLEKCKNEDKKYSKFLEKSDVIMRNYSVMQLESPIISLASIQKIEQGLDEQLIFNASSFKMKMLEDGITTMQDSFFQPFRIIFNNLNVK